MNKEAESLALNDAIRALREIANQPSDNPHYHRSRLREAANTLLLLAKYDDDVRPDSVPEMLDQITRELHGINVSLIDLTESVNRLCDAASHNTRSRRWGIWPKFLK